MDYLNHWLRKIDDRGDHKESDQETKITKESDTSVSNIPQIVPRESSSGTGKGLEIESQSSPKEHNEKIDEEIIHQNEEEKSFGEGSPKDKDEQNSSKNADLKNQPTSSTKLVKEKSKAESVQSKKSETPKAELSKPSTSEPQLNVKPTEQALGLRKKICQKMSKLIQDKYNVSKEEAQKLTLDIERKASKVDPHLSNEYRSLCLLLLKLLRVKSSLIYLII
jgi:hypothetical protein